jgi:hypothetical protein
MSDEPDACDPRQPRFCLLALPVLLALGCSGEARDRTRQVDSSKAAGSPVRNRMASSAPQPPLPLRDRLAAAARAQAGMAEGEVAAATPVYADRVPDLFSMHVRDAQRSSVAVLHVHEEHIALPAGLPEAARRLAAWKVLDRPDWKGSLIYVVMAAGGMTPGWSDELVATESPLSAGGVRIELTMPVLWVRYAASGGVGPPPRSASAGGGLAAPEPEGKAVLDIAADYSLRWSYQAGSGKLATFSARKATGEPALGEAELGRALAMARRRAGAPRAMPAVEPRLLDARYPGIYIVELLGIGPVHVDLEQDQASTDLERAAARLGALGVDLDAPGEPALLLPLLEAVGGMPPGLLASDLLDHIKKRSDGGLVAELSGPLVSFAAAGAAGLTPRSIHWSSSSQPSWKPRGRVTVRLDKGSIHWTLESGDGSTFEPLPVSW